MNTPTPSNGMQYPVIVRTEPSGQFTAVAVGLPELRATCADRDEAINRVRLQLCHWFESGQLVQVEIECKLPLHTTRVWKDIDPERDEFIEEIRRYREEVDAQFEQEAVKQACSNSSSTQTI